MLVPCYHEKEKIDKESSIKVPALLLFSEPTFSYFFLLMEITAKKVMFDSAINMKQYHRIK